MKTFSYEEVKNHVTFTKFSPVLDNHLGFYMTYYDPESEHIDLIPYSDSAVTVRVMPGQDIICEGGVCALTPGLW